MTEVAQALRDKTAVSGVGLLLGDYPDRTALSLAVEAYQMALDDAGMKREDVDGIMQLTYGYDYDRFLEAVGTDVRYANQGWAHGRFIAPMLQQAAMAVATGMAKAVAIVHGRRRKAYGQTTDNEMWRQGLGPHGESPAYGALGPVFGAAIAAQRYFHMYGGSNEDLAPIAVALRKHARLNPIAFRRDAMTIEDYLKSRWIVEPLRLFDCCQNNDGGACLIITTADRARDCKKPPVYISGMQGVHAGRQFHNLTLPGLGVAQQEVYKYQPAKEDLYAYQMAGITHRDVDALITYDAFSPLVLFGLERFGFCGPGEAREFVKNGRIELGGELPVNTSGGLLSEGHVVGWNLFIEVVRQLRHECGARQVRDAEIIQYRQLPRRIRYLSEMRELPMQPSQKMRDDATGRYLPVIYPEELPFWEGAKRRELWLQRCNGCGKAWYPIGPACPHCFSMDFAWTRMSGRGRIHNYVVYHKAWTPWFEQRVPYAVIQVELEEGPRLTTNLLDCPVSQVKIGMAVEVAYEDITGEITLVQFRPSLR